MIAERSRFTVHRSPFTGLIKDPPPLLVFEISEDSVTAVHRDRKTGAPDGRADRALESGVVEASAVRPNVRDTEALSGAVASIVEELGNGKRTEAAVLLPDASTRLTVLDFDMLPSKPDQRLDAIRLKLEKAAPFDIESARIAYQAEKGATGHSVLASVTPGEIVRQYEEAFDHAGLWPGWVEQSMSAALNLLPDDGVTMLAKLSGSLMTIAAVESGAVRMVRPIELTPDADDPGRLLDDMLADLYPTSVYVEEKVGGKVDRLVLAGFGDLLSAALERFPNELSVPAEPLRTPSGASVGPREAGIWGYLSAA